MKGKKGRIKENFRETGLSREIEDLIDMLIDCGRKGRKMKVNFGEKNYDLTSIYFRDIEF